MRGGDILVLKTMQHKKERMVVGDTKEVIKIKVEKKI